MLRFIAQSLMVVPFARTEGQEVALSGWGLPSLRVSREGQRKELERSGVWGVGGKVCSGDTSLGAVSTVQEDARGWAGGL